MKITKRQLRGIIKEFYKSRDELYDTTRAPELEAILAAAEKAHTSKNVSYAELKDFFWELNSVYANDGKIMEITKRQLRRIIREERARLEEQYNPGAMRAEQIVDMLTGKGNAHGDILMMLAKEIPDALIPVLEKFAQEQGINIRAERD